MKIKTYYELKPIPSRTFDWCAVDDDTYDMDEPVGFGTTEAEAIRNLKDQLEETQS